MSGLKATDENVIRIIISSSRGWSTKYKSITYTNCIIPDYEIEMMIRNDVSQEILDKLLHSETIIKKQLPDLLPIEDCIQKIYVYLLKSKNPFLKEIKRKYTKYFALMDIKSKLPNYVSDDDLEYISYELSLGDISYLKEDINDKVIVADLEHEFALLQQKVTTLAKKKKDLDNLYIEKKNKIDYLNYCIYNSSVSESENKNKMSTVSRDTFSNNNSPKVVNDNNSSFRKINPKDYNEYF